MQHSENRISGFITRQQSQFMTFLIELIIKRRQRRMNIMIDVYRAGLKHNSGDFCGDFMSLLAAFLPNIEA